jgi:extracellular factor (EF) 3-hydroxypalmitic acid methyl ester biosynthesis protein
MANLLEVLPEYVLHWLVQRGRERQLLQGEILFREGEPSASLFIVLDGILKITIASGGGDRVLERCVPGTVLGELSFFSGEASATTAVAEEPSLVLEIPHNILASKLEHDHGYASDFYRAVILAMSQRLRTTTRRLFTAEEGEGENFLRDPAARKAYQEIDRFKETMIGLDKQAIKQGGLTDEDYRAFFVRAMELMEVSHHILGANSPAGDLHKQRLGVRLQHEMLPYLLTTEVAERFYSKPRGYAGDYLAIHGIYRNIPGGTGRLGPLVDRMFLETPPSIAVRNRRILLANEIIRTVRDKPAGPVHVLCLASGPATEVFDAYASLEDRSRLRVTLMDIDLQALAFVDEVRVKQKLTSQINLVNENLIALFLGRGKTRIEPMDMIYSIGLIDYLSDKLVNKVLHFAHANLAPGGRVILGNFHPRNPAKEFMDHVLEWNLIHRTEEDMNRLFKDSPFARACTNIQFEPLGINLFAECVKEAG